MPEATLSIDTSVLIAIIMLLLNLFGYVWGAAKFVSNIAALNETTKSLVRTTSGLTRELHRLNTDVELIKQHTNFPR